MSARPAPIAALETCRVEAGVVLYADLHRARWVHTGAGLGLDPDLLARVFDRAVADAQNTAPACARLRLTASAHDAACDVACTPYTPPSAAAYATGLSAAYAPEPHPGDGARGKTTDRAWADAATAWADAHKVDTAIVCDPSGDPLEAPTATLAWREGTRWFTPSTERGVLASTTLQRLRALGHRVEPAAPTRERLAEADALCLLSALRLAIGVRALDGRSYARPDDGPRHFRDALLAEARRG